MGAIEFRKASKTESKLRLGIVGPSGAGKTMTALRIAKGLGGRIVVMDSEHGSASLYADEFDFDVFEPDSFSPQVYIDFLKAAAAGGYAVAIIDSLSHAWMGKDGALEMVDAAATRNRGNSFAGWRDVTPLHNAMIEAILAAPLHVIATMRSKTEWIIEEDSKGKKVPRKIGMQPVQRDGMEYEFTIVGDIDHDHNYIVSKSRCRTLPVGAVVRKPGEELGETLLKWVTAGVPLATDAQLEELRQLAGQISPAAAEGIEQRIAKGPSQPEAEEWLTKLRARVAGIQAKSAPAAPSPAPPPPPPSPPTPASEARAEANPPEPAPRQSSSSDGSRARQSQPEGRNGRGKTRSSAPITEAQGKRLWAISREAGYSDDTLHEMLAAEFQVASTKEITRDVYEAVCAAAGDEEKAREYENGGQGDLIPAGPPKGSEYGAGGDYSFPADDDLPF